MGRIVLREEPKAVVVPTEAVHWDGDCHVVFVRDKNFSRGQPEVLSRPRVRPGVREADTTEIIAGLLPGEVIASKNSVVLEAQLLKSNLGPAAAAPMRRRSKREAGRLGACGVEVPEYPDARHKTGDSHQKRAATDAELDHRFFAAASAAGRFAAAVLARRGRRCRCATSTSTPFPTRRRCRCKINTDRPGAGAGRGRAADHLPDRAGDRRPAGAGGDAVGLEVRVVAGRRHVRGRHRHLFRPAADQRAAWRRSNCPQGIERPKMGPVATGLGEVLPLRRHRRRATT